MTAPSSIDPAAVLHEHLAQASPDLMRELLGTFIDALLSAEADAVCGAGWGETSPERERRRSGGPDCQRRANATAGTPLYALPNCSTTNVL